MPPPLLSEKGERVAKGFKNNALENIPDNLNTDSGMLNTNSGKYVILFNFNRNRCSSSAGIPVQIEPEWVFRLGRNMHLEDPIWDEIGMPIGFLLDRDMKNSLPRIAAFMGHGESSQTIP